MKQKTIMVFTGTRSEYGILFWLLKDLQSHKDVDLKLVVSGGHLCREFGSTFREIEKDGFCIDRKVDVHLSGETPSSTAKSVGLGVMSYADTIESLTPHLVVVIGDRFETFAMAQAAFLMRTPIAHIHGGEVSEGANDDRMRHAITKLSDLHLTSTYQHKRRVEQMGEQPDTVMNVGAPSLEHIVRSQLPSVKMLSDDFNFMFDVPYIVIAYHSVTNDNDLGITELKVLLEACSKLDGYQFVLSSPNSDYGSAHIKSLIDEFVIKHPQRTLVRSSYGQLNFLSIVKHAALIIGNSSSAILEAPSLLTPSIDIGSRQGGRERASSVFSADGHTSASVERAIHTILNRDICTFDFTNPYFRKSCVRTIIKTMLSKNFSAKKPFYNLATEVV